MISPSSVFSTASSSVATGAQKQQQSTIKQQAKAQEAAFQNQKAAMQDIQNLKNIGYTMDEDTLKEYARLTNEATQLAEDKMENDRKIKELQIESSENIASAKTASSEKIAKDKAAAQSSQAAKEQEMRVKQSALSFSLGLSRQATERVLMNPNIDAGTRYNAANSVLSVVNALETNYGSGSTEITNQIANIMGSATNAVFSSSGLTNDILIAGDEVSGYNVVVNPETYQSLEPGNENLQAMYDSFYGYDDAFTQWYYENIELAEQSTFQQAMNIGRSSTREFIGASLSPGGMI